MGIASETRDAGAGGQGARDRPPPHSDPHGAAGVPASGFSTTISRQAARRVRNRPGEPPERPGPPPGCGGSAPARRGPGQKGGRSKRGARGDPGRGGRPGPDPAAARRRLLTGAVPSGAGAPRADPPRLPPTLSEAPARTARTPLRTRSRGRRAPTPQRRAPGAWTAAGPGRPLPAQNSTENPRVGAREGIRENQNWRPYVQAFRPAAAAAATKRFQTLAGVEVAARGAGPGGVRGAGAPRRRPHPFPTLPWRRPGLGSPAGQAGVGDFRTRVSPPPYAGWRCHDDVRFSAQPPGWLSSLAAPRPIPGQHSQDDQTAVGTLLPSGIPLG